MTERWVPVAGFEGFYEVSDLGRVRSLDRFVTHKTPGSVRKCPGQILTPGTEAKGYLFVTLWRDGSCQYVKVHHLVARAFLPASEKPQINHKDFDKKNNGASNLEWVTAQENSRHRIAAIPGISGATASSLLEEVYASRRKPARIQHPKVKTCLVCGDDFTPRPTARERAKTCSWPCANALRSRTTRITKAKQAA